MLLLRNAAVLGRASASAPALLLKPRPGGDAGLSPPRSRRHVADALSPCRSRRHVASAGAGAGEGYEFNFSLAIDKAHEGKSLAEIAKLPPGALQGLKEDKADAVLAKLGVKSVAGLGQWKHFKTARAVLALSKREADGGRPAGAKANVNLAVDKAWERRSLREIAAAPPSALQGLTPEDDETLRLLGVKSVADLGKWKYALWADAIATLVQYESADFESR